MKDNNGINIKEGRSNKQYINTNFDFIDALNNYADCETLGFYISFKRYINRKDNTKENPLVEKSIVYFSTLEDINISLKGNLEKLISEYYPEIPEELIKIVDVINNTNYIFHDYPPIEILESNNHKFDKYRDWDILMNRFSRGKNKDKDENTPPSQNENHPPSQNRKVNNIIELDNNRIESSNNIINQSIKGFEKKEEKTNKTKKDRLIDQDKKIKEKGFISYDDLIYELRLEKEFFKYPISDWIDSFKKALWEMYYYEDTRLEGRRYPYMMS